MTKPLTTHATGDWTEPGAFEVATGVHRVPLPLPDDGLRAVNAYVLESADGLVLIDSGWALPTSESALTSALAQLGYELRDIRKFFITHMHADHYTYALLIRERYGAEVYLGVNERPSLRLIQERLKSGTPPSEFPALRRAGAENLVREIMRQEIFTRPSNSEWSDPSRWLEDNDSLDVGGRSLDVIETPGHTQGHVVYRDATMELLFAGDHVLPSITPSVGFEPARSNHALRSFLDSLTKLLTLTDTVLLPAHGMPGGSVHQRVRELLNHHATRLAEMLVSMGEDTCCAFEVAQRVTWTSRHRHFDELSVFNQMLAVLETDCHLRLLAAEGDLRLLRDDETDRYKSSLSLTSLPIEVR